MAGIDAPYRDPREELRNAVFGAKPAPAAALPPPEPIPVDPEKAEILRAVFARVRDSKA